METMSESSAIEDLLKRKVAEQAAKPLPKPKKSTQSQKASTGMAGEFYVAAELCRRGLHASVTYGNSKRADVLALDLASNRFVRIEVKTTRRDKGSVLVMSGKSENIDLMSDSPDLLWVLVILPKDGDDCESPAFNIFTSAEMKSLMDEKRIAYDVRRGKPFTGDGMWTVDIKWLDNDPSRSAWGKIIARIEAVGCPE